MIRDRRAGVVAVPVLAALAAAAVLTACATGAPEAAPPGAGPTTGATASGVLPPPGSFVTSIVQSPLPEPVAVPGEPTRRKDDPHPPPEGKVTRRQLEVAVPDEWRSRGLLLCGWTSSDGFLNVCAQLSGGAPVVVPLRDTADAFELWLVKDGRAGTGYLRRLVAFDPRPVTWPYAMRVAPGYPTVDDVLTRQPLPDGNYLVPA